MELLPFLLVGLLAIGGLVYTHLQRRRKEEAFGRLIARDPTLTPTASPLGWDRHHLSATCTSLPEGDRRFGLDYGVEGPVRTTMAGEELHLECAAFRWWWEQRRQNGKHGHRYETRRTTVALVRLPVFAPTPVRIRPESVLGRLGITRGGRQLESSEFNRAFRVETSDDRFAVLLLDADLQATLLEAYRGRSIELVGDLLLLEGEPAHRDDSLPGAIGQLPAVRQDIGRLVAAVPAQVWRQLDALRDAPPRPTSGRDGPGLQDGAW
jgi:hypothetical protein